MPIKTPLTYLRQRRDQAHVRKPTTHAKVASYSYINPQISSPLFSQIPGEIRHLIYEFALLASPDPARPFSKHSWYYRPGYTHARFINTNLLLTCRRVYLEAGHLAVSQNEHLLYQPVKHGPPGHKPYLLPSSTSGSSSSSGSKRRGLLKQAQREKITQVHIFTQQYWLEDWNNQWFDYCNSWSSYNCNDGNVKARRCHPERLKITIRHTDWWYFLLGENSPLALDPKFEGRAPPRAWIPDDKPFMPNSWGSRFKLLKGLKVFELELETLQRKKRELDEVIERAHGWRLPLEEGKVLVCDQDATAYDFWMGSRHFKGLPNSGASDPTPGLHLLQGRGMSMSSSSFSASRPTVLSRTNSIVALTKKNSPGARRSGSGSGFGLVEEEEIAEEDRLEYYVVTLTFRAQEDKGTCEETEDGEDEEATTRANSSASASTPAPVRVVSATAQQGVFTPTAWVPRRSGFPSAYG